LSDFETAGASEANACGAKRAIPRIALTVAPGGLKTGTACPKSENAALGQKMLFMDGH